jgi:hypothetical protein
VERWGIAETKADFLQRPEFTGTNGGMQWARRGLVFDPIELVSDGGNRGQAETHYGDKLHRGWQ